MLEAVYPLLVAIEQRSHTLRMLDPQFAERAAGLGERAVQQNQERPPSGETATRLRGDAVPLSLGNASDESWNTPGVDLRIDATYDFRCREIRCRLLADAGDDLYGR